MSIVRALELIQEALKELSFPAVEREDEWLTTAEASKLCKVDRSTLTRLALTNRIPAKRVGKQWRFKRSDIEGFDR